MFSLTEKETEIENERFTEYGILTENGSFVDCVSPDKSAVMQLITELNKGCAEECHLFDIVEDWIEEKSE